MAEALETMRAVVLTGHGGPEKLEYHEDWPKPAPGPGEVLVRVGACGLNNTDVNTRTGWYSKGVTGGTSSGAQEKAVDGDSTWGGRPLTFPRIQGADVCGTVEAVGDGADPAWIGKRVLIETWFRDWDDPNNLDKTRYLGSELDGGFAEYTAVNQRNLHAVECDLTDAELATFATANVTAENMLARAEVGAGDLVLITGASGGVGSALIQLANRRGARTVAMSSTDKADAVRAVGPEAVLERSPANLKAALHDALGRDTVSVVADVVGGPMFAQLIDALERGGRFTCSGAIAGPIVDFYLRTFYLKDLTFTGATVVPPGLFADLAGYINRGEIRPLLAAAYPLANFHDAQQAFIDKRHVGNIVVTMDG